MGFFLLGRSADDTLSLLSTRTFESRPDALAELSRITAEPQFTRWDEDVLLIDLDTGTPVLLVRPTQSPAQLQTNPEAVAAPSAEPPEPAAFSAIADDELIVTPIVVPGPRLEPQPSVSGPEPTAPAAEAPDEAGTSLRDAIARSTEQMEASGVVAPASIGPAEVATEPDTEVPAAPAPYPTTAPSVEPIPEPEVEPTLEPVAEPAAEPVVDATPDSPSTTASASQTEPEPLADASLVESAIPEPAVPAWPWDTPIAEPASVEQNMPELGIEEASVDPRFVLEGLEEPAHDDEPLLGHAESAEASALAIEPPPQVDPSQPATDVTAPDAAAGAAEPTDATVTSPADEDVLSLGDYTCGDCVYADTCPNRDQRLPKDCGSFQWK